MKLFVVVVALVCFISPFEINAQEAPPRFKKFEFPSGKKTLYPYGDTIILVGQEDFEVTTDGGKTWDLFARDSSIRIKAHPNHPVLYYSDIRREDSIWSFYISKDLGRTFERRAIGKDTIGAMVADKFYFGEVGFSPSDPDLLFVDCAQSGAISDASLMRSRDGGRTWFFQKLPLPTDGSAGFGYEISFNRRLHTRWHLVVGGTWHSFYDDYYYTDDDGESFVKVKNWGEYAGITHNDELMSWDYAGGIPHQRGPYVSTIYSEGREWDHIDWFSNTGLSNFERSDTVIHGFSKDSYSPWLLDPSIAAIRVDSTVYPAFEVKSRALLLLRDGGASFELLWYDTAGSLNPRMDPRYSRVWVYRTNNDGVASTWYTDFSKSSIARGGAQSELGGVQVYPNPASEYVVISLDSPKVSRVQIIDPLGKILLEAKVETDRLSLPLNHLHSGMYTLVIQQNGQLRHTLLRVLK